MSIQYCVETKKIIHIKDKYLLKIDGYYFSSTNEDTIFHLLINEKPHQFEVFYSKYESNSFSDNYSFRFRIEAEVFEEIDSLVLDAQYLNDKQTLLYLEKNEISSIIDSKRLIYTIDKVLKDNQHMIIQGWVFSVTGSIPQIKIYDNDNKNINFNIQKSERYDLCHQRLISYDQIDCGFEISFDIEKKKYYRIRFMDDDEFVEVELSKQHHFDLFTFTKKVLKKIGFDKVVKRFIKTENSLSVYENWLLNQKNSEETIQFDYEPLISIVVPTFNTPKKYLRDMIDSVLNQTYRNVELCIADGSNDLSVMDEIRKYAEKDARIKFIHLDKNYGISGNTNKAVELASGEYIGLFDHDDILDTRCIYEVVKSLQKEKYDIIYTDEDKTDETGSKFFDPAFKPDFNTDMLYSYNYLCHFFVVKKEIMDKVGGFRDEYNGSQDYDLVLRCIRESDSIHHIPKILYHWRVHQNSTAGNPESKLYCYSAAKKALEDNFSIMNVETNVNVFSDYSAYHTNYLLKKEPLISIIIYGFVETNQIIQCLESIKNGKYKELEILLITDKDVAFEDVNVIVNKNLLTKSQAYNIGINYAKGDYLLFLNGNCIMKNDNSINEMVGLMQRDEVGVVGAKILDKYDCILHAGIVIRNNHAGYIFRGLGDDRRGYISRALINSDYTAVSFSCMLVKKELLKFGNFNENVDDFMSNIEFCLKLKQHNYLTVYNAFSKWYSMDSKLETGGHFINIKDFYYSEDIPLNIGEFYIK